ncbi:hypothetical protein J6Z48_00065 [bacterium]|nr:hypothetical protein [bacterium]
MCNVYLYRLAICLFRLHKRVGHIFPISPTCVFLLPKNIFFIDYIEDLFSGRRRLLQISKGDQEMDDEKYTWKTGMIAGLETIQRLFSEQPYASDSVRNWVKGQIFTMRSLSEWVKLITNTPQQEYVRGFEEAWRKTSYLFSTDSLLIQDAIEKRLHNLLSELEKEEK